jgi:LysR family transcriptional regulator (chromosome initiation inhibitor)
VLPELQVRGLLASGELVNLAPRTTLPVNLYWHCWNLDSVVIDRLTDALSTAAGAVLKTARS